MYNTILLKRNINHVTKALFKKAIFLAYKDGIKSVAPLGFSGDTIRLFGEARKSEVSIRNYSGDAELLITDMRGNFIFYGRFDINLGIEFVSSQYWNIFKLVKDKISTELKEVSDFSKVKMAADMQPTEGFAILQAYQKQLVLAKIKHHTVIRSK